MLQTIYPRAGLSRRQGANQLGRHLQAERLGHANVGIALDTYSHAIPAMQEEAAAPIAGLVSAEK